MSTRESAFPMATPRVRAAWAHRVAAEYRSAAVASELLHWALVLGVPPALVGRLHALVDEELGHAECSRAVHALAGGAPAEVQIPAAHLWIRLFPFEPMERRALAAALQELAFHEAIALQVFRVLVQGELHPLVRESLVGIVRDEARHRRLGWQLTAWLLEHTGQRAWLLPRVPMLLDGVLDGYGHVADPTPEERMWGLADGDAVARAVQHAVRGGIARNLQRLALGPG